MSHFLRPVSHVMHQLSHVMCNLSCFTCPVSKGPRAFHLPTVTCHLSLMATATAKDPPPANSPIMNSRLVCKDPKTQKQFKHKKSLRRQKLEKQIRGMPILSICSSIGCFQSTGEWGFGNSTDRRTRTHPRLTDIAP